MSIYDILNVCLSYIEDNLKNDIQAESVFSHVNYSPTQFRKMFKTVTGYTINQYITKRKLSEAAKELKNIDTGIVDIALQYGYENHGDFSYAFKKEFGVNPNEYRRNNCEIQLFERLDMDETLELHEDLRNAMEGLKNKGVFRNIEKSFHNQKFCVEFDPEMTVILYRSMPALMLPEMVYDQIPRDEDFHTQLATMLAVLDYQFNPDKKQFLDGNVLKISFEQLDSEVNIIENGYDLEKPMDLGKSVYYFNIKTEIIEMLGCEREALRKYFSEKPFKLKTLWNNMIVDDSKKGVVSMPNEVLEGNIGEGKLSSYITRGQGNILFNLIMLCSDPGHNYTLEELCSQIANDLDKPISWSGEDCKICRYKDNGCEYNEETDDDCRFWEEGEDGFISKWIDEHPNFEKMTPERLMEELIVLVQKHLIFTVV